jgi:beta-1,4-mannosyltransferase
MKCRAYIYPRTVQRGKDPGSRNPYLNNFIHALRGRVEFVNEDRRARVRMLHMVRHLNRIDMLFLNWIEDLPATKGGYIQSVVFLLILYLKSMIRIKIVWTMHNKISHSRDHFYIKKLLFKKVLDRSDLVITHASDGVSFAVELIPNIDKRKVFLFQHPIDPASATSGGGGQKKDVDILIWGTLAPYKGVDKFLEYLDRSKLIERYRIKIVGKCSSDEYYQSLAKYESRKISIENRFIERAELEELIAAGKVTLFTYSDGSVLSSGALMDSIACKASVVGPHVGAFKDLAADGLVKTYKHFDELPEIIDNIEKEGEEQKLARINEFLDSHTWDKFGAELNRRLEKLQTK